MRVANPRSPSPSPEALAGLREVYASVDREVEAIGPSCRLSGRCCDFEHQDHRLYATGIEIELVRTAHPQPFPAGSLLCPFWKEGLCTERELRPLGCRTYFCDDRHREPLEALHERALGRIKRIARRCGSRYRYLPFVQALRSSPEAPLDAPPTDKRSREP